MKKHVDDKVISLPPYVSTAWENVKALYLKDEHLIVDLIDGNAIAVPNLTDEEIEEIFDYHAVYIDKAHDLEQILEEEAQSQNDGGSPFRFAINSMDGFTNAMSHNPAQANMPPLPPEVLDKISNIAKIISPEEINALEDPVEGCHCFYCQISKAIQSTNDDPQAKHIEDNVSEDVSDEDLQFSQWAISQLEDKLYLVTNKLDTSEQYKVFLGNPIGCTCGNANCEHIVAVLKS